MRGLKAWAGRRTDGLPVTKEGKPKDPEPVDFLDASVGTTPGLEGLQDEHRVAIEKVAATAADAGAYKPLIVRVLNGLERGRRLIWFSADDFVTALVENDEALRLRQADSGFRSTLTGQLKGRVLQKRAGGTSAVAEEVKAAIADLERRLARDRGDALGPSALRETGESVEKLLKGLQLQQQLSDLIKTDGVAAAAQLYSDKMALEDDEAMRRLEDALTPALVAIVETPAPKLHAQRAAVNGTERSDQAVEERIGARRLLHAFDDARLARVPAALLCAEQCLEMLRPIFRAILGVNDARYLSRAAFAEKYLSGRGIDPRKTWEIDEKWPIRQIDSLGRVMVSGWSPRTATDGYGNAVRRPVGR